MGEDAVATAGVEGVSQGCSRGVEAIALEGDQLLLG
jgi:hypothetical protein